MVIRKTYVSFKNEIKPIVQVKNYLPIIKLKIQWINENYLFIKDLKSFLRISHY